MKEFLLRKNNKGFSIFADDIEQALDVASILNAQFDGELIARFETDLLIQGGSNAIN